MSIAIVSFNFLSFRDTLIRDFLRDLKVGWTETPCHDRAALRGRRPGKQTPLNHPHYSATGGKTGHRPV